MISKLVLVLLAFCYSKGGSNADFDANIGLKSNQKCVQYYNNRSPVNAQLCNNYELQYGRNNALGKEFPHMALLGYRGETNKVWLCSGSLISERYVLTSGHCLYSLEYGQVNFVRLGDLNIERADDDASPQEFGITERILHPDYRPPALYDDLALLKLDNNVTFTEYIRPACLHTEQNMSFTKGVNSAWGTTTFFGNRSDDLLKAVLEITPEAQCNRSFNSVINSRRLRKGIVSDSQFCAAGKQQDQDICQGSGGSPLQIHLGTNCAWSIIGVTSFGKACGLAESPTVYTRVSHYIPWIESVVWP